MRTHADRREMIESLMNLIQKLDLETEAAIKMETDLLMAYSLVQIEKHLADLKPEKEAT